MVAIVGTEVKFLSALGFSIGSLYSITISELFCLIRGTELEEVRRKNNLGGDNSNRGRGRRGRGSSCGNGAPNRGNDSGRGRVGGVASWSAKVNTVTNNKDDRVWIDTGAEEHTYHDNNKSDDADLIPDRREAKDAHGNISYAKEKAPLSTLSSSTVKSPF